MLVMKLVLSLFVGLEKARRRSITILRVAEGGLTLFLSFLILPLSSLFGQWEPDVRLTFNDSLSATAYYNQGWCVAAGSGEDVHVVWREKRDGNYEIYYKRSQDGGTTWGTDINLSNDPAYSMNPSVAVSGTNVYAVWLDYRDGTEGEIYFKRSQDGGSTWRPDTNLSNDPNRSEQPSLCILGTDVHVVWRDSRDGFPNFEIYYKHSPDGGTTWGPDTRLTADTSNSGYPSVAASGSDVHVVWTDWRNSYPEIYYKRSTNGGTTWGSDIRLTDDPHHSFHSCIAVSGLNVHVTWEETRDGTYEIYYKRSTDGGATWGPDIRLTNSSYWQSRPSISVSDSLVHIVFHDDRNGPAGNNEIYYKCSINGGIIWSPDTRLTNDPSYSLQPFVAVSDTIVHVIWSDSRDGNREIYYKRNPSGNSGIIELETSRYSQPSFFRTYIVSSGIEFEGNLPYVSPLSLRFYDITGRKIVDFVHHPRSENFSFVWKPNGLSSGVYFVKASQKQGFHAKTRLVWLKH